MDTSCFARCNTSWAETIFPCFGIFVTSVGRTATCTTPSTVQPMCLTILAVSALLKSGATAVHKWTSHTIWPKDVCDILYTFSAPLCTIKWSGWNHFLLWWRWEVLGLWWEWWEELFFVGEEVLLCCNKMFIEQCVDDCCWCCCC